MTDAVPIVTLCLGDPVCLSLATAGLTSLVAVARRLQSLESVPRSQRSWMRSCREIFVGGTYTGAASFAVCFAGVETWPEHLALVAATTVVVGIALDWSSEFAGRLLRRTMVTIARTYLQEIIQSDEAVPPKRQRTFSKDVPPSEE
jgi:hypothetical protein